jgi:hypothetical protein
MSAYRTVFKNNHSSLIYAAINNGLSHHFADLPAAQHGLGKVHEKLNHKDQALAAYKKAVELATTQEDDELPEFEASFKRFVEGE